MPNPKIAELRSRITIQNLVRAADGQGGYTESWVDYASVWAKFVPMKSSERYFSEQLRPENYNRIDIRYIAGLTTSMKVLFDGRVFQIQSIVNMDERKFFIALHCQENVGS